MINPVEHVKTFEEKIKQKRQIRQEKILKSRIKSILPTQTTIKMYIDQIRKNQSKKTLIAQSQVYKLFTFDSISPSQYQKILSNPMYYLQNDRNIRFFKMFLRKNCYFDKMENKSIKENILLLKQNVSLDREKYIFQYQFTDKTKINYKQPWKYIKDNVGKYQKPATSNKRLRSRSMFIRPQAFKTLQPIQQQRPRKKSQLINKNSPDLLQLNLNPLNLLIKQVPKLQTNIQVSTNVNNTSKQYKSKIKQRQQNTESIKYKLLDQKLNSQKQGRIRYFNKLMESQLRMKSKIQIIKEAQKVKQEKEIKKCQKAKLIKQNQTKLYSSIVLLNQQIRQTCLNTYTSLHKLQEQNSAKFNSLQRYNSDQTLLNQSTYQKNRTDKFNKIIKSKQTIQLLKRKKQRNENLKAYLQKRLGIQQQDEGNIKPFQINPQI